MGSPGRPPKFDRRIIKEHQAKIFLRKRHAAQEEIVAGKSRFNVCCLGRRTGKSVLGLDILLSDPKGALEGFPVAWFAPAYKYLDEVFREAKGIVAPVKKRVDSQQHRIELVGGGAIDFWTMDDDDPARGRKYSIVVLDEADMTRRLIEKWNKAVRPTLIDFQGEAWFLSTPRGIQDFHKLYLRGTPESDTYDPAWRSWRMPSHVNPFLEPGELEDARKELPELVYRQEILAEFVDAGGTIVFRDDLRYCPMPDRRELQAIAMGVDLAISTKTTADYTALVVLGRTRHGNIFVLDVVRDRVRFHDGLLLIQRVAEKWSPGIIGVEAVQFQAAAVQELLRTTALPVKGIQVDKDKMVRFQPVAARYEQNLIFHVQGLPAYFEEELLAFPVGANDDMVDAQAHAFASLGMYGKMEFHSTGVRPSVSAFKNY